MNKQNISYLKLDLLDEKKLTKFVYQNGICTIINVAALTDVEKCEKNKKRLIL